MRFVLHASLLAMLVLLAGCSSVPKKSSEASKFDRYAPVTVLNDKFPRPIKGTFYVRTIPAFYTNPEIIEQPRQRQAESFIIMFLERAGLKHSSSMFDADWIVHYDYSSEPEIFGPGYRHSMNMTIGRRGTVGNYSWNAKSWIPHSANPDVGSAIILLTSMLTSKFPDVENLYVAKSNR